MAKAADASDVGQEGAPKRSTYAIIALLVIAFLISMALANYFNQERTRMDNATGTRDASPDVTVPMPERTIPGSDTTPTQPLTP